MGEGTGETGMGYLIQWDMDLEWMCHLLDSTTGLCRLGREVGATNVPPLIHQMTITTAVVAVVGSSLTESDRPEKAIVRAKDMAEGEQEI